MIKIIFRNTQNGRERSAEIPAEHGPALHSAIQEIRNELGGRVEGQFCFKKEHALTRASSAVGLVAAALNHVAPEEDPDYETCRT